MSEYVTYSLGSALIELMKNRPIEKITVDELTAKANVGRVTYFRNFRSKDDILTQYIVRKWRSYEQDNHLKEYRINDMTRVLKYFELCYSMREINDVIIRQERQTVLMQAYESVFQGDSTGAEEDAYERAYMAHGLYGVLLKWAKDGYRETPRKMAELVVNRIFAEHRVVH